MKNKMYTKKFRFICLFLAFQIFIQAVFPVQVFALTSGPTQPEFSKFEPVNATEMVDIFSGDFKYNLPLLNVPGKKGGYPINLFYNSVTNMEEEASMVGLGWNLGIGQINRTMRGIPDDFNGEPIEREVYIKPQVDITATVSPGLEFYGLTDDRNGIDEVFGSVSLSTTFSYSSYEGLGLGYGLGFNAPLGKYFKSNFAFDVSTLQGANYSMGISAASEYKKTSISHAGIGISGNALDLNMSVNVPMLNLATNLNNWYNPVFKPNHDLEYDGISTAFSYKGGGKVLLGIYPSVDVKGTYSKRRLRYNSFSLPSFGSMYSENGQKNKKALLDFQRVNDNAIHKNTTHLAVPVNTDDVYSMSSHEGQNVFSFYRGDAGFFKDAASNSKSVSGEFSIDAGIGTIVKAGGSVRYSYEHSANNPAEVNVQNLGFTSIQKNSIYENGAFRSENEMSGQIYKSVIGPGEEHKEADKISVDQKYMNNEKPVDLSLQVANSPFKVDKIGDEYRNSKDGTPINKELFKREKRHARSKNIIGYKKQDVYSGNNIILPYLQTKIFIHNQNGSEFINHDGPYNGINYTPLTHDNQITAFEEVNPDGKRMIFGLPVINKKTRNVIFAIDESNGIGRNNCTKYVDIPLENNKIKHKHNQLGNSQILDVTEIPEYVHSYMLTNILGEDYIDTDPNDGEPNDKDLGHWVKFSYIKSTGPHGDYKWRIPYTKANYNPGKLSLISDGTGSYSYGEREQYYPYLIETDSHIAKFYYSVRTDNRGAGSELQNEPVWVTSAYTYKLDKIELYAKGYADNNVLEKTVHFEYKPLGLCKNILNSADMNKGKLTLEKVYINHYNSTRGMQNPYKFSYTEDEENQYDYNPENFDRWGVIKLNGTDHCLNQNFPYTRQDEMVNEDIKAFHLKTITLPSGSVINVDVSRDHYAFVQDKPAAQMFKIVGIAGVGQNRINPGQQSSYDILFQGMPNTNIKDYTDGLYQDAKGKQVLFKIKPSMLKYDANLNTQEFIMGGAYLTDNPSDHVMIDPANGIGKIKLKVLNLKMKVRNDDYRHPFSVAAWQYLKTHLRRLLMPVSEVEANGNSSIKQEIDKFLSYSPKLTIFKSFFNNCVDNQYGAILDLNESFIRLNNPIKKKYGGNVKVDKVYISDIWNNEGLPDDAIQYGNTYTYEEEVNGKLVSTGVASNEPEIAKEENAVYHIKNVENDVYLMGQNYHFEIHPVNDMFMPSPTVGYSKVTVRSLSSHDKLTNSAYPYPGASTTGEVVHEFYTAKDFPTIFENSNIKKRIYSPSFQTFFLFARMISSMTATQGYVSETNDMHGKPRKSTYYEQNRNGSIVRNKPVSSVEYKYKHKKETYYWGNRQMTRNRLDNDNIDLQVGLQSDMNSTKVYKGSLGKKIKMYSDVRKTFFGSYSLGVNLDFDSEIYSVIPFLMFMVFPNTKINEERLETAVTNKHISKKGILDEVIAFNGLSSVTTKNLTFDAYTGVPLTTSVTNHFDNPVFNVSVPAYQGYPRMGAAMHNTGLEIHFEGKIYVDDCTGLAALDFGAEWPSFADNLVPGDEFIIKQKRQGENTLLKSGVAVFEKKSELCCGREEVHKTLLFYMNPTEMDLVNEEEYVSDLILYRSGNRNMLQSPGQQVACLDYSKTSGALSKILSGQANTYSDFWRYHGMVDDCQITEPECITLPINRIDRVRQNGGGFSLPAFGSLLGSKESDNSFTENECNVLVRTYFAFDTEEYYERMNEPGTTISSATISFGLPENFQDEPQLLFNYFPNFNVTPQPITWNSQPDFSSGIVISNSLHTFNFPIQNPNSFNPFFGVRLVDEDSHGCRYNEVNGNLQPLPSQTVVTICFDNNPVPKQNCEKATNFTSNGSQYKTGSKGVFLPDGQYHYTDKRNNNSNIAEKGVLEGSFSFLNWSSGIVYAVKKVGNWLLDNKVTTRNKALDIVETKNALGIYNAVHYVDVTRKFINGDISYTTKSPNKIHATVQNSQYYESMTSSFEKYEEELTVQAEFLNNFILASGNNHNLLTQERAAVVSLDQEGYLTLDKPYYTSFFNIHEGATVEVYSGDQQGNGYPSSFVSGIESVSADMLGRLKLKLFDTNDCDKINSFAYHHAIIHNYRSVTIQNQEGSLVDDFAHAGKRSLRLDNNDHQIHLRSLKLIPGKKYYFTCWIGTKDNKTIDISEALPSIMINNNTSFQIIPGKINGWQQVRGSFIAPEGENVTESTLQIDKGQLSEIYIDDIRIHPQEAVMESYVYDDKTFQLKYMLDDNNYYTKYVYDGEGKMVGIQKETERGVKTIQENRSYLKPSGNGLALSKFPHTDSFLNKVIKN